MLVIVVVGALILLAVFVYLRQPYYIENGFASLTVSKHGNAFDFEYKDDIDGVLRVQDAIVVDVDGTFISLLGDVGSVVINKEVGGFSIVVGNGKEKALSYFDFRPKFYRMFK